MKYLFFIFFSLLLLSCEEDKLADTITSDGTLIWLLDPAMDGCGLVLEVDSIWYFTSSRKNTFINFTEEDSGSIDVTATYKIIGPERTAWGCTTTPIEVIEIKRR